MRLVYLFLLSVISLFSFLSPSYAHSISDQHPAAIASATEQATEAGKRMLAQGGNAFDAAAAVASTLAVTEPYYSGLGGGGFFLIHTRANNKNIFIDARESAPSAASATMYQGKSMDSTNGARAAAIPGEVAGIVYLVKHYGNLSLEKDLQPAIKFAREGFPVTKAYREMAAMRLRVLQTYPDASQIFLHNGTVPAYGDLIVQTDLADALELIAKFGKEGFYHGAAAKAMVQAVDDAGGIWTEKDLESYHVIVREPLTYQFANFTLITAPLPSAGGIGLITLFNIISNFDKNNLNPLQQKELNIEAMRRVYLDRLNYLGDSDYITVPVSELISKAHAKKLASTITIGKATPSKPNVKLEEGQHTTHFSIIDKDGNMVAATLSINFPFGSGFVPAGTGILLNDTMDDFSKGVGQPNVYGLVGSKPNEIAPNKRPLSSMTPSFVIKDDGIAVIGTPGGSRIITMVFLGIEDFLKGRLPVHWVSLPRYHQQYLPDTVQYELGAFSLAEQESLKAAGYKLSPRADYGNMQAILWRKKSSELFAASDPRGEGKALVIDN